MGRDVWINSAVKREHGLRCPRCGKAADGGTQLSFQDSAPPEYTRGQHVICAYCGALNVYEKPLLRTLDRKERRALLRSLTPEQREQFELTLKLALMGIEERKREAN